MTRDDATRRFAAAYALETEALAAFDSARADEKRAALTLTDPAATEVQRRDAGYLLADARRRCETTRLRLTSSLHDTVERALDGLMSAASR